MAHHPILERYLWFDQQIRKGKYPNSTNLAERFELSQKTAQRDIAFLRDRLDAPLEYDKSNRGYHYSDDGFRLPPLFVTERQLIALLLAQQVLKTDGCRLDCDLGKFAEKLQTSVSDRNLTPNRMNDLFSAIWSGHAPAEPKIFQAVLRSLTRKNLMKLNYKSPTTGRYTGRTVESHHLQYYQGSWLLLAWCCRAKDWRKFYLARMKNVHVLSEAFSPRACKEWRHHLEGAFGIYQGENVIWVRLRFTAERARWIREQQWHERQKIIALPGGRLELRLPVADLREIHLRVLQYGPDVEVIEPEELREMIRHDIVRMDEMYNNQKK